MASLQLDLYLSNAKSLSFYDVYLLVELPTDNSVGYEGKHFFSWSPPHIGTPAATKLMLHEVFL